MPRDGDTTTPGVPADILQRIKSAQLPADVEAVALLEAYHRSRILASPRDRREQAYREAYEALDRISRERGQVDHGANPVFSAVIRRWGGGAHVVELGCGAGALAALVAHECTAYIGVDASAAALHLAKQRAPTATFLHQIAPSLSLPPSDLIYSNDFFEHLHPEDLIEVLQRCRAALRPRGVLAFVTSNARFGPFDVSRRFLEVGESPAGLHLSELSYRAWREHLRAAGFTGSLRSPILPLRMLHARRALNSGAWISTRVKEHLEIHGLPARPAGWLGIAAVVIAARSS